LNIAATLHILRPSPLSATWDPPWCGDKLEYMKLYFCLWSDRIRSRQLRVSRKLEEWFQKNF
jgi:hypothetical protein